MKSNNTNKIKVLLVSPYDAARVGGIGTWTKLILDYVENRNEICVSFLNTASPWKQKALHHSLTRLLLGVVDSALILIKLFFKLLTIKPDVIHYTSSASYALAKDLFAAYIAKMFHVPFVIHWRFGRIPDLCKSKNREYRYLLKVIDASSASIMIDKNSYNYISKESIVKPIFCIPNPVSQKIQNIATQIKIKEVFEERKVGSVLFVGHVIPAKGVYELVKACSRIDDVRKVYIVGPVFEEKVKQDLLSLSGERDRDWLCFEGELKREEVLKYYRSCAIFCLPSYTEGFPNVVLEAMANGIPIIASSVGAVPEMLEANSGVCVPARDVDSLQTAISYVLQNPIEALLMAEKARQKVLRDYTVESVFNEYHDVWKAMLS